MSEKPTDSYSLSLLGKVFEQNADNQDGSQRVVRELARSLKRADVDPRGVGECEEDGYPAEDCVKNIKDDTKDAASRGEGDKQVVARQVKDADKSEYEQQEVEGCRQRLQLGVAHVLVDARLAEVRLRMYHIRHGKQQIRNRRETYKLEQTGVSEALAVQMKAIEQQA
jgi:hypothetical protein